MSKAIGYKRRSPGTIEDVLSRAFAQAGGVNAAADQLPGRTPKRLYDAANPDAEVRHEVRLAYDEARLLTRANPGRVTALAEDLALLAGGVFLPGLQADAGSLGAQASRFGREAGEALQAVYAALEDGNMDRAEADVALPQIREAISALADLYRLVEPIASPTPPTPSTSTT